MSLDGCYSLQRSMTSTKKPASTADVVRKMREKGNETSEVLKQRLEAEARPIVYSGFHDCLSEELWPG